MTVTTTPARARTDRAGCRRRGRAGSAATVRCLTAVSLAAVMASMGGGVATAGPPSEAGVTRSTHDYAFAFIGSRDAFMAFDVFAPSGADPFGIAEIHVMGYECFPQNRVEARVDGLTSASAVGAMELSCSLHVGPDDAPPPEGTPREVAGIAHVDLTWTGEGPVERRTIAGRYTSCVAQLQIRHAAVAGGVRVVIPDLDGFDQTAVPLADDDNSLRHEEATCRAKG